MILAYMFILHFIADFLLQSREMGKNKSSNYTYLFKHISIIFAVIFVALIPFLGLKLAFIFSLSNALIHAVIDKFIWNFYKAFVFRKLVKKYELKFPDRKEAAPNYAKAEGMSYPYYEDHWFYATIGFDQLLHALTLIILAGLLL